MQFGYSAETNTFYFLDEETTYRANGFWQEDIIPVSDEVWSEFVSDPPTGKQRGANEEGAPCWVDSPVLSENECRENIRVLREDKINEAVDKIRNLVLISGITKLTAEDSNNLEMWHGYIRQLYETKVDDKVIHWPDKPAFKI